MDEEELTLLNTSILTSFGTFVYQPLTLVEARAFVHKFRLEGKPIQSAIGHQTTAELLSSLLEYPVAVNRMEFKQTVGTVALVFKLKGRPPEGKVLTRAELESMGYELGLLRRTA